MNFVLYVFIFLIGVFVGALGIVLAATATMSKPKQPDRKEPTDGEGHVRILRFEDLGEGREAGDDS